MTYPVKNSYFSSQWGVVFYCLIASMYLAHINNVFNLFRKTLKLLVAGVIKGTLTIEKGCENVCDCVVVCMSIFEYVLVCESMY